MKVAGLTITRASRQSRNRATASIDSRVAAETVSWPDFVFLKERKLFAQEQVLGDKCRATDQEEPEKVEQLRF
ncbi:MAG: hypothetical protein A2107_01350 [Verrucomicrobia bacterium GWF2_62_7]|nr:MAG: hypothetical protein A2107_01350 [Verrucomicrobia bacterium GWF2_62_7]